MSGSLDLEVIADLFLKLYGQKFFVIKYLIVGIHQILVKKSRNLEKIKLCRCHYEKRKLREYILILGILTLMDNLILCRKALLMNDILYSEYIKLEWLMI